ncbi:MAG: DNA-formamidopyrimidine glycosylase [Anaerolineaceae bacterium 4572_5.2]|nr:MAG: DNA-formamidopyrimidine glycosylase [Anaerolineaceae bacterium 4572_5.2]
MPELPEVETIIRNLRADLIGRTIQSADLRWERTLATPSPATFSKHLQGQEILRVNRRAKYIRLRLTVEHLLIHLRMSGDLLLRDETEPPAKHDRLLLHLDNGQFLAFNDTRKFGRVWLTGRPEDVLGHLGPEPLSDEFTAQVFYERLQKHHRQLKPLLLDQSFLAGMGNIYTDEALHLAGLHPLAKSDLIKRKQAKILWRSLRSVLQEGIRRNGASIDWIYRGGEYQHYLRVYGREGEPCPLCGAAIQRIIVGQRGTHFCSVCQPLNGA